MPPRSAMANLVRSSFKLNCIHVASSRRLFSSFPTSLTALSSDRQTLQHTVRQLCDSQIRPFSRQMDEAESINPEIVASLFNAGLMGIEIEEEHGGASMDFFDTILVVEEVAKADASVAALVDIHNTLVTRALAKYGTDQQKASLLPRLVTNTVGAFCLSESHAGSDAFNLKCRATKVEGGWHLSGTKEWISNSKEAGVFIVFATDDSSQGYKGISAFLIEVGQPGLMIGKKFNKLGIRASSTCEVILDNVFVSESRLLGERGKGYLIAIDLLNEGRIGIGAQMVGLSQAAFDLALDYIHERKQFNQRIVDFQGVQFQIAELATDIEASRLLVYNAAMMKSDAEENPVLKDEFVKIASMAKLHSSRTAQSVSSACIDLLGGAGFTTDYLAEKYYRDAKIGTIYEGTTNIQLLTIAKQLQKKYS